MPDRLEGNLESVTSWPASTHVWIAWSALGPEIHRRSSARLKPYRCFARRNQRTRQFPTRTIRPIHREAMESRDASPRGPCSFTEVVPPLRPVWGVSTGGRRLPGPTTASPRLVVARCGKCRVFSPAHPLTEILAAWAAEACWIGPISQGRERRLRTLACRLGLIPGPVDL
jgi:hypothetical protein